MHHISFQEVSKNYQMGEVTVDALHEITLDIEPGLFVVLLGPSGSGKTTLLNLISAIDYPSSGKIQVENVDISFLNRKQRAQFRRHKIGFIFQFFNLIPTLTALENIEFALDLIGVSTPNGSRSFNKKKIRDVALNWLDKVGLKDRANHFPSQLSGGQQQRVAIARALSKDPPIVVADEPTGNLDYRAGVSILKLMKELNVQTEKTFILATHNQQISKIADLVLTMQMGQVSHFEQREPINVENLVW
ncbi:MAG: ABC transporter ATP-binding protein [Candidatus Heimdallarchaeota archaeon]|nr:MAG: ABC transporter ATP-binding protein [Candidatus Heimdallarchaeota archaeon]